MFVGGVVVLLCVVCVFGVCVVGVVCGWCFVFGVMVVCCYGCVLFCLTR